MKLFSKRKKIGAEPEPNALYKGMQAGYKRLQSSWAEWMKKRTEKFSRRTWIVLLILFVLSTSSYSVYLAASAFTKGSNSFTITPIKKPTHATQTGEAPIETAEVSETEYNRIKRFRVYMDSLARSPSGKIVYDSITRYRPGLMDSVRFIENYYKQLKQK